MKEMTLKDLLAQKLNALLYIEEALVEALPKMAAAATDKQLKKGFKDHLKETRTHVKRIKDAHKILGTPAKPLSCAGIDGIIKDGAWVIKHVSPAEALDANLARAARYAEHYEAAGYLGAISLAQSLNVTGVEELLQMTLQEEEAADQTLADAAPALDAKIKNE